MECYKFKFIFFVQNDLSNCFDDYCYFDTYDEFLGWYEFYCKKFCNSHFNDCSFIVICVNLLNKSYRSFFTDDWNKVPFASYFYEFINEV